MRTFDHPNYHGGFTCPFCNTSDDRPVTLRGIPGTEADGNMEAEQFHADCATQLEDMLETDRRCDPIGHARRARVMANYHRRRTRVEQQQP